MLMSLLGLQKHRCRCPGIRQHRHLSAQYVNRARRFVDFLIEEGIVKRTASVATSPTNDRVRTFQSWCGDTSGSLRTNDRPPRSLDHAAAPALGNDPASCDAGLSVRRVVLAEMQRSSRPYVKTMTTALRGKKKKKKKKKKKNKPPPPPPPPSHSGGCRRCRSTPRRRRRAADLILLTSASRMAPATAPFFCCWHVSACRAADILNMRLDDIAWANGTLRVRGKGRREIQLPLPQDAGDALLGYLETTRPCVASEHVFLRLSAPHRPFAVVVTLSPA